MDTNRIPKQALKYEPKRRRHLGRPRERWRDHFHFEDAEQESNLILPEHDDDNDCYFSPLSEPNSKKIFLLMCELNCSETPVPDLHAFRHCIVVQPVKLINDCASLPPTRCTCVVFLRDS